MLGMPARFTAPRPLPAPATLHGSSLGLGVLSQRFPDGKVNELGQLLLECPVSRLGSTGDVRGTHAPGQRGARSGLERRRCPPSNRGPSPMLTQPAIHPSRPTSRRLEISD